MPIPYMGSKRKSAGKIYQTIKNHSPEADTIVDLFCGGFAISEFFIKNGWSVIANDLNKYVIALLDKTINQGLPDEVYDFVDRARFEDVIKNPEKYEAWYAGYVMCVWSFGNNQQNYLFGRDVESIKRAGHELVVNKNAEMIKEVVNMPQKYIDGILRQDSIAKRRMALNKVARVLKNRTLELQQLQQLQRLERLQQLEQLQQLERLQQLEKINGEKVSLFSLDYRNIEIPDGAVIYCDPPYQGTAEYREGGFNHAEFWEWVREKSKTHDVYVSEYTAPDDFKKVLEFQQNSTLASGNNKNQPNECVFKLTR